ncbi:MAG: DUF998 domain-containing protein [Sphingobacteriaceae bacterium]|nr:MAG: DUF998 domain-containing protein [Sphingobacteriaceae bacterium]
MLLVLWKLFFLLLIQYFIVQFIVGTQIPNYSIVDDYISALGDSDKSPLYWLMNCSFFLNGLLIILGAAASNKDITSKSLLYVSGIGAILVALNPENKNGLLHTSGAGLSFVFGNLSLLSLGLHAKTSIERTLCFAGGGLGFSSFVYFSFNSDCRGLVERMVSYPESVVLIASALI